jgi:hypothetical protein
VNRIIQRLLRIGMRQGWNRGVVDGNPAWLTLGAVAVLAWLGGRALHREPEVVFLEKLKPGQTLRITHEATS